MLPSNRRRSVELTRSLVCAVMALAIAAASCSSIHQVPAVRTLAGQPSWQVKAGQTIRVVLRNGTPLKFTVQSMTPDAVIASDGTRFKSTDIASVETRGFDGGKTAVAIVAFVAFFAITASDLSFEPTFNRRGRDPD